MLEGLELICTTAKWGMILLTIVTVCGIVFPKQAPHKTPDAIGSLIDESMHWKDTTRYKTR